MVVSPEENQGDRRWIRFSCVVSKTLKARASASHMFDLLMQTTQRRCIFGHKAEVGVVKNATCVC